MTSFTVIVVLAFAVVVLAVILIYKTVNKPFDIAKTAVTNVTQALSSAGQALLKKMQSSQTELGQLRTQITTLTQEIDYLKSRKISVDQTTATLKLALTEAKVSTIDYCQHIVPAKQNIEYLGIFEVNYVQIFGIDLEKLSFKLISPDRIAVKGLGKTELIGAKAPDIKKRIAECRQKKGLIWQDVVVLPPDDTLKDEETKHYNGINHSIYQGKTSKDIDVAIERLTLAFLQLCLKPAGFDVVSSNDDLPDAKGFVEICTELNKRVVASMEEKERQRRERYQRAHEIEAEISNALVQQLQHLPAPEVQA